MGVMVDGQYEFERMQREWLEVYASIRPQQRRGAVFYVSTETIEAYCAYLNLAQEQARIEQVRRLGPEYAAMPAELIQPAPKIVPLEPMTLFGRPLKIDDAVPFGELRVVASPPRVEFSWD